MAPLAAIFFFGKLHQHAVRVVEVELRPVLPHIGFDARATELLGSVFDHLAVNADAEMVDASRLGNRIEPEEAVAKAHVDPIALT